MNFLLKCEDCDLELLASGFTNPDLPTRQAAHQGATWRSSTHSFGGGKNPKRKKRERGQLLRPQAHKSGKMLLFP